MRNIVLFVLLACATLASGSPYIRRQSAREDAGPPADPSEPSAEVKEGHQLVKRGLVFGTPQLWHRHKLGRSGVTEIPYCWLFDRNNDIEMKWVEDALNERWNALGVLNLVNTGYCNSTATSNASESQPVITVAEWDECYNGYLDLDNSVRLRLVNIDKCEHREECGPSDSARRLCIQTAAVHEFGHALGIDHEHVRPDAPLTVRDRNPHCEAEHRKMERDPSANVVLIGPWDGDSLMNYCLENYTDFTRHSQLSLGDKATVLSMYGMAGHFNAGCTNNSNPNSLACKFAIHGFCRKVLNDSALAMGILRGVTNHGLNVTCFTSSFALAETPSSSNHSFQHNAIFPSSIAGEKICGAWAALSNPRSDNTSFLALTQMKAANDSSSKFVLCKAAAWRGRMTLDELDSLSDVSGTIASKCYYEITTLHRDSNDGYPPTCITAIDEFCSSQHNDTAGTILSYEAENASFEVACFEPDLKFELLTRPTAHMLG